jgi:hypothetical protein
MEIKIQIKGRVWLIVFGKKLKWSRSINFINIIEEEYDNSDSLEPTYATLVWHS